MTPETFSDSDDSPTTQADTPAPSNTATTEPSAEELKAELDKMRRRLSTLSGKYNSETRRLRQQVEALQQQIAVSPKTAIGPETTPSTDLDSPDSIRRQFPELSDDEVKYLTQFEPDFLKVLAKLTAAERRQHSRQAMQHASATPASSPADRAFIDIDVADRLGMSDEDWNAMATSRRFQWWLDKTDENGFPRRLTLDDAQTTGDVETLVRLGREYLETIRPRRPSGESSVAPMPTPSASPTGMRGETMMTREQWDRAYQQLERDITSSDARRVEEAHRKLMELTRMALEGRIVG